MLLSDPSWEIEPDSQLRNAVPNELKDDTLVKVEGDPQIDHLSSSGISGIG